MTDNDKCMQVGGRYNWKNQPERLIYIGYNWSGNGFWHQFVKVDNPDFVWCEVQGYQLKMIEETAADNALGNTDYVRDAKEDE